MAGQVQNDDKRSRHSDDPPAGGQNLFLALNYSPEDYYPLDKVQDNNNRKLHSNPRRCNSATPGVATCYFRFKYDKLLSDRLKVCHSWADDNVNVKPLVSNLAI